MNSKIPYFLHFKQVLENDKKLYSCRSFNCNKKFTRLSCNAKRHVDRHLEKNLPYMCSICFMGFWRFCDLSRHSKSCEFDFSQIF